MVARRGMSTASPRPAAKQSDEAASDSAKKSGKTATVAKKKKEDAPTTKSKFSVKKVDGGDSQIGYFLNTAKSTIIAIPNMTADLAKSLVKFLIKFASNPIAESRHIWDHVKADANHYWVGSKLLWTDIKIASGLVSRLMSGSTLTRRERRQLIRTTTDILRIVPFSFFLIVPFMELLLPVAIRLFPSMLPSTFEKQYEVEAAMKRDIKMRVNMAGFMKDMLREMAKDVKTHNDDEGHSAAELTKFVEKARHGTVKNKDIVKFAKLFHDDLTLDNMGRAQLVTMCSFMNLRPYGADAFLRFQLRSKIRDILEDDRRIVWEGVEVLSRSELQEACMERGMRGLGVPKADLARQLQQWLDLSCNRHVPISLLIMSRSFALTENPEDVEKAIADSISSLDEEIVNEAVLEAATPEERKTDEIRELKIEAIKYQSELIDDEREDAEEDKKKAEEKKAAKKAAAKAAAEEAAALEEAMGEAKDAFVTMHAAHMAPVEEAKGAFDVMAAVEREEKEGGTSATDTDTKVAAAAATATEDPVSGSESAEVTDSAPRAGTVEEAMAEAAAGMDKAGGEVGGVGAKEGEKDESAAAATTSEDEDGDEDEEDGKKQITLEEIEALADYASSSAVEGEMEDIAGIKSKVDEIVSVLEDEDEDEDDEAIAKEEEMAAVYAAMSAEEREAAMAEMPTSARMLMVDVDKRERDAEAAALESASTDKSDTTDTIKESDPVEAAQEVWDGAEAAQVAEQQEASEVAEATTVESEEQREEKSAEEKETDEKEEEKEEEEEEEEEEVMARDRTLNRVKSRLDAMLEKLEADVAKVDEAIGDKMHVLDLDDDGLMSADELEQVLRTMMKVKMTPEEAQSKVADLMEQIDEDMDGVVSVHELREWVKKERAKKAVKVHEDILVEDEEAAEKELSAEAESKEMKDP